MSQSSYEKNDWLGLVLFLLWEQNNTTAIIQVCIHIHAHDLLLNIYTVVYTALSYDTAAFITMMGRQKGSDQRPCNH